MIAIKNSGRRGVETPSFIFKGNCSWFKKKKKEINAGALPHLNHTFFLLMPKRFCNLRVAGIGVWGNGRQRVTGTTPVGTQIGVQIQVKTHVYPHTHTRSPSVPHEITNPY